MAQLTDRRRVWREERLPLALFLALAAARAARTPIDLPEAVVLTRSEIPLGDLALTPYSPAFLVLLHVWAGVSASPLWLRGLSLVLAVAALALVPRVLRSLGGVRAGGGAMWILCLSPFFVGQMVSLSPSALALLTVVLGLWCFFAYLRTGRWPWLAGWVAASLVSLLVHGGLYYLVLALGLGMLLYRARYRGRQRLWWLAQVLPLALFALLCGTQFERFVVHRVGEVNSVRAAAGQWGTLGSGLPMPWPVVAGALLALLVGSGLRACRDGRGDPRHGLLALGATVPAVVWLVWLPHDFYAVAALPFLAVLASMGIRLYPRWARQVLWTAVLVTYGWSHWQALL